MDTRKRLKRQTSRKAKIVEAASRLAVTNGLDDLSLSTIAKAADISKGTLYYYYPTKEALIFDVAEKHVRDITDYLFELIESGGPQSDPEELIRLLFQKHKQNRLRMRLHLNLVYQAMNGNAEIRKRYQEIYAHWQNRALEAIARLFPGLEDPETMAYLLITTIDGLNVQTMLGLKGITAEALARYFAATSAR